MPSFKGCATSTDVKNIAAYFEEPHFGEPHDLTREKIGELLELVIEQA